MYKLYIDCYFLIYKVSFCGYKVDIKLKVSAILLYIVKGGKRPLHGLSGGAELHIPLLGTRMREVGGQDRRSARAGADPAFGRGFSGPSISWPPQCGVRGPAVEGWSLTGPQQRCG